MRRAKSHVCGNDTKSFRTIPELLDFLLTKQHRGMWFFAHAGGLFDMEFVLDELLTQIKNDSGGRALAGCLRRRRKQDA